MQLANFFESYAGNSGFPNQVRRQLTNSPTDIMELNVWLQSTIAANPTFDEATKKWTVVVNTNGKAPRTMQVSQLVSPTQTPSRTACSSTRTGPLEWIQWRGEASYFPDGRVQGNHLPLQHSPWRTGMGRQEGRRGRLLQLWVRPARCRTESRANPRIKVTISQRTSSRTGPILPCVELLECANHRRLTCFSEQIIQRSSTCEFMNSSCS